MTKATFLATMFGAFAITCGASAVSAEPAAQSEGEQAEWAGDFTPIPRYDISFGNPRDLAEFNLHSFGMKMRAADYQIFDHPDDATKRIVLVTQENIKGGPVTGAQWRFIMRSNAGQWETAEAGMRRKCRQGPGADRWTIDICP